MIVLLVDGLKSAVHLKIGTAVVVFVFVIPAVVAGRIVVAK